MLDCNIWFNAEEGWILCWGRKIVSCMCGGMELRYLSEVMVFEPRKQGGQIKCGFEAGPRGFGGGAFMREAPIACVSK